MAFYFYHLFPKNITMNMFGIITPDFCYKHGNMKLYKSMTDKYRKRLVGGWGIYPNKKDYELTLDEIYSGINTFRKGSSGNNQIYFFKFPPSPDMGENMAKVLRNKCVLRIDIDDPLTRRFIDNIDWGYESSHTDNPKLNESWYRNIGWRDYFKNYNDKNVPLFATLNHISITPKLGYIPSKLLTTIHTYSDIVESSLDILLGMYESERMSYKIIKSM